MASRLNSATLPTTVTSGASFNITVHYESTSDGQLALSVDQGFTVAPRKYPLTVSSPGSVTFGVTITRVDATSQGCTLSLRFGSALDPRINEVKAAQSAKDKEVKP